MENLAVETNHADFQEWAAVAEPHLLCMMKTTVYHEYAQRRLLKLYDWKESRAFHYKAERKKTPTANDNGHGLSFVCYVQEGKTSFEQRSWCQEHHLQLFKKMHSLSGEKRYIIGIQLSTLYRFQASYIAPPYQVPMEVNINDVENDDDVDDDSDRAYAALEPKSPLRINVAVPNTPYLPRPRMHNVSPTASEVSSSSTCTDWTYFQDQSPWRYNAVDDSNPCWDPALPILAKCASEFKSPTMRLPPMSPPGHTSHPRKLLFEDFTHDSNQKDLAFINPKFVRASDSSCHIDVPAKSFQNRIMDAARDKSLGTNEDSLKSFSENLCDLVRAQVNFDCINEDERHKLKYNQHADMYQAQLERCSASLYQALSHTISEANSASAKYTQSQSSEELDKLQSRLHRLEIEVGSAKLHTSLLQKMLNDSLGESQKLLQMIVANQDEDVEKIIQSNGQFCPSYKRKIFQNR